MPRSKRKSSQPLEEASQSDDESSQGGGISVAFSQVPEPSQGILAVKPSEQRKLESLKPEQREKVLMDLSRLILFKALAGEPIDRLKCFKEAGLEGGEGKMSTAVMAEVSERLENVFGFELTRYPLWMEKMKSVPSKYKDRYYVLSSNLENVSEGHSKAIYAVHADAAMEKGLLMLVLALVFCKGDPRSDGSRWILDVDLYRLLNTLDENIPADPPSVQGKKKGASRSRYNPMNTETPNVDELLEKFVRMDYLLKEKISEERLLDTQNADENSMVFALGPRSAVEIGRKQIVYFCAEILDEEPDPTMLLEIDRDEELDEQMDGGDE